MITKIRSHKKGNTYFWIKFIEKSLIDCFCRKAYIHSLQSTNIWRAEWRIQFYSVNPEFISIWLMLVFYGFSLEFASQRNTTLGIVANAKASVRLADLNRSYGVYTWIAIQFGFVGGILIQWNHMWSFWVFIELCILSPILLAQMKN